MVWKGWLKNSLKPEDKERTIFAKRWGFQTLQQLSPHSLWVWWADWPRGNRLEQSDCYWTSCRWQDERHSWGPFSFIWLFFLFQKVCHPLVGCCTNISHFCMFVCLFKRKYIILSQLHNLCDVLGNTKTTSFSPWVESKKNTPLVLHSLANSNWLVFPSVVIDHF